MNSAVDFAETGRPAGMGVLAATCVSTLVVNANTSAVTILLPAIAEDVGASVSTLQWAVTGYSLVGAEFIVTSGALGDVFGRRKVFLGGLALFIASCVLIALSDSQIGIIGGRMIQGAAGSTILASGRVCSRSRRRDPSDFERYRCGGRHPPSELRPDHSSVGCSSTRRDGRACSGSTPQSQPPAYP